MSASEIFRTAGLGSPSGSNRQPLFYEFVHVTKRVGVEGVLVDVFVKSLPVCAFKGILMQDFMFGLWTRKV